MKIAVIGAGAIGNLVAGYLKTKGEDVTLLGHRDSVNAIEAGALRISGARGDFNIKIDACDKLNYNPELVILATKTQDIDGALKENLSFLAGATILTTQNGIRADDIVAQYIPKKNIISSIVMFGATYLEPAKVVHNFEGDWIIGRIFERNDAATINIKETLSQIFSVTISENIRSMKYLKIFVNANNCIPAILGLSMQEAFSDVNISRISIAIWKEGLEMVNKAGINLLSLPDFPLERLVKLTAMPLDEAARVFSGIMANLSKEPLYGSILQSIKRRRASEIDYINGEFLNLARVHNTRAPLNEKLVEMVHRVEKTNNFFAKEDLFNNTKGLLD